MNEQAARAADHAASAMDAAQPGAKDAGAAPAAQRDQSEPAAQAQTTAALSPEQQAQAAETFRQLGEVTTLMTASPQHRYMFIGDLEWMGLPAIVQRQCYLYREDGRTLAAVFWARVSGEIEDRFKRGVMKLAPAEWRSGDNLWLVNVVDPFKKGEALLKAFAGDEAGANGATFSFTTANEQGQRVIAKWTGDK